MNRPFAIKDQIMGQNLPSWRAKDVAATETKCLQPFNLDFLCFAFLRVEMMMTLSFIMADFEQCDYLLQNAFILLS